jgi:hypothetical protein
VAAAAAAADSRANCQLTRNNDHKIKPIVCFVVQLKVEQATQCLRRLSLGFRKQRFLYLQQRFGS